MSRATQAMQSFNDRDLDRDEEETEEERGGEYNDDDVYDESLQLPNLRSLDLVGRYNEMSAVNRSYNADDGEEGGEEDYYYRSGSSSDSEVEMMKVESPKSRIKENTY